MVGDGSDICILIPPPALFAAEYEVEDDDDRKLCCRRCSLGAENIDLDSETKFLLLLLPASKQETRSGMMFDGMKAYGPLLPTSMLTKHITVPMFCRRGFILIVVVIFVAGSERSQMHLTFVGMMVALVRNEK